MSGPKVVNIEAVRRQQRRECNSLLREITALVEECLRLNNIAGEDINEFQKRSKTLLGRLNDLGKAEQWEQLRVEASAQREFYRSEAENLRSHVVARRASALRSEHRLRIAAKQMIAELSQMPPSVARDAALEKIKSANDAESLESALGEAMNRVSAERKSSADASADRLLRLAVTAYADPHEAATSATKPSADQDPNEARLERCWSLLGELDAQSDAQIDLWKQKAMRATSAEGDERSLLLDSLALELTSHLRACQAQQAACLAVKSVLVNLANVSSPGCEEWRVKLHSALAANMEAKQALEIANAAQKWLDEEIRRQDAEAQRTAVLQALTALGYEVREGMAAAWAENGRVVVQKPQEAVYGIELSAPRVGSAFQVRVVAEGTQGRSKQRDLEIEQTWCGEFARLQEMLKAEGFSTKLTNAHPAGTIPIKSVEGTNSTTDNRNVLKNRSALRSTEQN